MFTVTIAGRPNVGKSTLFNSLVRKKSAITYNQPGITRDRKEEIAHILGSEVKLIDTAGFELDSKKILAKDIAKQINYAVEEADLVLLVIDAKSGLTNEDFEFVSYIRKKDQPIILIINKSESKAKNIDQNEVYRLGFQTNIYMSAEHHIGYTELFEEIDSHHQTYLKDYAELEGAETKDDLTLTIIGKPNVGKSTLINSLVDKDRLITCDESGTTRDSISVKWEYKGKKISLIDTAGIRKKNKIVDKKYLIEKLSIFDSLKAIRFSQICILLLDATQSQMEKQDMVIASHAIAEGRGLLVALNKCDLLEPEELNKVIDEIKYQLSKYIPQNKDLTIFTISAKYKTNIFKLIDTSFEVHKNWNFKIATSELNKWLAFATTEHRPALEKGREVRLKYISQIKSRPPTFSITTNHPDKISDSYIRYLKKSLVDSFDLKGVIPRFILKKSHNPYSKNKNNASISHKK